MGIAYGIDVKHANDPYISVAQKALYAMNVTGNVGTYLVDYIPACKSIRTYEKVDIDYVRSEVHS